MRNFPYQIRVRGKALKPTWPNTRYWVRRQHSERGRKAHPGSVCAVSTHWHVYYYQSLQFPSFTFLPFLPGCTKLGYEAFTAKTALPDCVYRAQSADLRTRAWERTFGLPGSLVGSYFWNHDSFKYLNVICIIYFYILYKHVLSYTCTMYFKYLHFLYHWLTFLIGSSAPFPWDAPFFLQGIIFFHSI